MTDEHLINLLRLLIAPGAWPLLQSVGDAPGRSSSELAQHLGLRKNVVSTAMQLLLAYGIAMRIQRRAELSCSLNWAVRLRSRRRWA